MAYLSKGSSFDSLKGLHMAYFMDFNNCSGFKSAT